MLAELHIAPDLPDDGSYLRRGRSALFGDWDSTGHGCTTRDAVLVAQTSAAHLRGCHVESATLADPYSGQVVTGPASRWDIDHVFPVGLAWQTGARTWSAQRRHAFYVDQRNLVAANLHDNRSKGEKGPERWMPSSGLCRYAVEFTATALAWGLTVTPARKAALGAACPSSP